MALIKITFDDLKLQEWTQNVRINMQMFASEFIQDLNNAVVINTPVIFGFLRGSWFAGLNSTPTGAGSADPSGGDSIARMNAVAVTLTLGDIYRAINTAVYAARVEYGFVGRDSLGRKYSQAGRGFVRSAVAHIQPIADAAMARVRSRMK